MNLAEQRRIQAQEVSAIFQTIDQTQIDALVDAIMQTDRVFISGWGRAGNVARILGMNCSQLGKLVFCVGDNGTPAIQPGNLLIIVSGSGNTKTISIICQQAREHGANIALISGNADSVMGKMADINVVIPRRLPGEVDLADGVVFEKRPYAFYEAAFMLNDYISTCIRRKTGQTLEDVKRFHNNLE